MGKSKTYYVEGNFNINDIDIFIKGKMSAVSTAQANYYCCLDIQKDLDIDTFIDLTLNRCQGMDSTMNYLRNKLPDNLMYYLKDSNNTLVKQDTNFLKEKINPKINISPKETISFENEQYCNEIDDALDWWGNLDEQSECWDDLDPHEQSHKQSCNDIDDEREWWGNLDPEEQAGWIDLFDK